MCAAISFGDFVNAIGDDVADIESISLPVSARMPEPEPPLDMPAEPKVYEIELTEDTLSVADRLGLDREGIRRFHTFCGTDFGNDARAAGERLRKYWKNEKLDDKNYLLMSDFVYARGLQKFVRGFSSFICGESPSFKRNMLIRSPHGFLKQPLVHYLMWLMGLYRAGVGDMPKDKWVLKQAQAPALSVLDIQFLKEGLLDRNGADTGGCNLKDIYSSPLLCVYLCGDARVDSEIVHEIYSYRTAHMQEALSCFVVLTTLSFELYNSDRFYGDIWKEIVVNTESDFDEEEPFDSRLHRVYCYFKSDRDVLAPLGEGSAQSVSLLKSLF